MLYLGFVYMLFELLNKSSKFAFLNNNVKEVKNCNNWLWQDG